MKLVKNSKIDKKNRSSSQKRPQVCICMTWDRNEFLWIWPEIQCHVLYKSAPAYVVRDYCNELICINSEIIFLDDAILKISEFFLQFSEVQCMDWQQINSLWFADFIILQSGFANAFYYLKLILSGAVTIKSIFCDRCFFGNDSTKLGFCLRIKCAVPGAQLEWQFMISMHSSDLHFQFNHYVMLQIHGSVLPERSYLSLLPYSELVVLQSCSNTELFHTTMYIYIYNYNGSSFGKDLNNS